MLKKSFHWPSLSTAGMSYLLTERGGDGGCSFSQSLSYSAGVRLRNRNTLN